MVANYQEKPSPGSLSHFIVHLVYCCCGVYMGEIAYIVIIQQIIHLNYWSVNGKSGNSTIFH